MRWQATFAHWITGSRCALCNSGKLIGPIDDGNVDKEKMAADLITRLHEHAKKCWDEADRINVRSVAALLRKTGDECEADAIRLEKKIISRRRSPA